MNLRFFNASSLNFAGSSTGAAHQASDDHSVYNFALLTMAYISGGAMLTTLCCIAGLCRSRRQAERVNENNEVQDNYVSLALNNPQ